MRRFVAAIIVLFANLMTCTFSSYRRISIKARVSNLMLPAAPVVTKRRQLLFYAISPSVHSRASQLPTYEPETLEWVDSMEGDVCFWDIGANIGTFSMYAALKEEVRVLSFEPAGSTYHVFSKNIELNRLTNRVSGYCLAFSGETKLDTLNMSNTEAAGIMHGFGTEVDQHGRAIRTIFRQGAVGFSIDDFVALFLPPLPTHVKIDVDGIEADILRGGRKTLSAPSLRSMIVEVEGNLESDHNREIIELMEALGFTARPKADPRHRNIVFDRPAA